MQGAGDADLRSVGTVSAADQGAGAALRGLRTLGMGSAVQDGCCQRWPEVLLALVGRGLPGVGVLGARVPTGLGPQVQAVPSGRGLRRGLPGAGGSSSPAQRRRLEPR